MNLKVVLIFLAAVVVLGGTGAAVYLSQKTQESRSGAAPGLGDWVAAKSVALKCNEGYWSRRERIINKYRCLPKERWQSLAEEFCQRAGGVKYFYGINPAECGQTGRPTIPPPREEQPLPTPTGQPITPAAPTPTGGIEIGRVGYYQAQITCKLGRWSQSGRGLKIVELGRCLSVEGWRDLANRFCPDAPELPNYSQLLMVPQSRCGL